MAIKINYTNEFSKLKSVVLYRPAAEEIDQGPPDKSMYISIPNVQSVLEEFDGIVHKLQQLGIEVIVLDGKGTTEPTSNMIFLRDVAFVFKSDIILARMKHDLRKNEPIKFRDLLLERNPELLSHIKEIGHGTFEGADLIIKDNKEIMTYTGSRTTETAIEELKKVYPSTNFINIPANIDRVPQHLLGSIHIIDQRLVTRRVKYCAADLDNYKYVNFDEDDETGNGLSLNILTVGPSEVLMPKNRNKTKAILEANGITCHEIEINEIHKMGGGLACMVLPIDRC